MAETARKMKCNFTLTAVEGTPDGSLLKYYQQLKRGEARQHILEAAAAFWSPLAAKAAGINGESLRCLVVDCLYRLRTQEKVLDSQFLMPIGAQEKATREPVPLPLGGKKVTFRLTYQVYAPIQANLVRFLMEEEGNFSRLQKVLWSSQAFWGAIAEREVGQADAEQLSRIATYCIGCLREHIDYLKNYFEYREIADGTTVNASSNPTVLTTSSPPPEEEKTEGNTEVMSEEEMEQWLRHDPKNDDWRSNLFN